MIQQVTLSCCSDICVAECCSSILCDELVKMCVVMQYVHESHGLQQNPKKNLKTIIKYKPSHKLFSDYSAIKNVLDLIRLDYYKNHIQSSHILRRKHKKAQEWKQTTKY